KKLQDALIIKPVYQVDEMTEYSLIPPSQYDHEYKGELKLHRGTLEEVMKACHSKSTVLGCAWRGLPVFDSGLKPDFCEMWIVNDDVLYRYNMLYGMTFRHETGHCNGWRHLQPGEKKAPSMEVKKDPPPVEVKKGIVDPPFEARY